MDEAALREHVRTLAAGPRVPGTPGHTQAARYIQASFDSFGLRRVPSPNPPNVIGEVGPAHAPLVVVGAHYDSVEESPGADDNASGVAALIELARVFASEAGLQRRVQFAAYDHEETGFLGSEAHCAALQRSRTQVVGMLSLEMVGYTAAKQTIPPGVHIERSVGDFLAVVADEPSAALLDAFEDDPIVECVALPAGAKEAAMMAALSDHSSFRRYGWPALIVTDTAFLRNLHYHRASDTPESLDYRFLTASAEAVLRALRRLAQ